MSGKNKGRKMSSREVPLNDLDNKMNFLHVKKSILELTGKCLSFDCTIKYSYMAKKDNKVKMLKGVYNWEAFGWEQFEEEYYMMNICTPAEFTIKAKERIDRDNRLHGNSSKKGV